MMKYNMQLLTYHSTGGLVGISDSIPLGSYTKFPVKEVMTKINEFRNNIELLNMACGFLPMTIEFNSLRVVILVFDETDDPICYSEMYEYKHS